MKNFLAIGLMVMALTTQIQSKRETSKKDNSNLSRRSPFQCRDCQEWENCLSGKCVCAADLCEAYNADFSCIEGQCQCDDTKCPTGQFCSQKRSKGKSGNYFEQQCVECQSRDDCAQEFEVCVRNNCVCNDRICHNLNFGDVCNQDGTACVDCTAQKGCRSFQQCNLDDHMCICDDVQCGKNSQVCSALNGQGRCVECRDDNIEKCLAEKPFCLQNACVECLLDTDCPNPAGQACNSGVCQCSEAKCNGNGKTCESTEGQCVCSDEYCLTIGTEVCDVLGSTGACSVACRDDTHCSSQIQSCDTTGTPICICDSSKCGALARCNTQDENGVCIGVQCVAATPDSDGDGVNDCRPGQICNINGVCQCDIIGTVCTDLSGICLADGECKVTDCTDLNDYGSLQCAAGEVCLANSDSGISCTSTQIRCKSSDGYFIDGACPTGMSCLADSEDPTIENSPYCVPICTSDNGACLNFECGFDYVLSQGICALSADQSVLVCQCNKEI